MIRSLFLVLAWTTDASKRTILGSTVASRTQLRLPAGDKKTAVSNIVISIQDLLGCITEYTIYAIYVRPDNEAINALVDVLQQTNIEQINSNPMIQLLAGGNQNIVGQILTSIAQVFNQINTQNMDMAISSTSNRLILSIFYLHFFLQTEYLLQVYR